MRKICALMACVLLLGAGKSDPLPSKPDANGWSILEGADACVLFSDAKLAFAAPDGQRIALVSPGALGGNKTFQLDSGTLDA